MEEEGDSDDEEEDEDDDEEEDREEEDERFSSSSQTSTSSRRAITHCVDGDGGPSPFPMIAAAPGGTRRTAILCRPGQTAADNSSGGW